MYFPESPLQTHTAISYRKPPPLQTCDGGAGREQTQATGVVRAAPRTCPGSPPPRGRPHAHDARGVALPRAAPRTRLGRRPPAGSPTHTPGASLPSQLSQESTPNALSFQSALSPCLISFHSLKSGTLTAGHAQSHTERVPAPTLGCPSFATSIKMSSVTNQFSQEAFPGRPRLLTVYFLTADMPWACLDYSTCPTMF